MKYRKKNKNTNQSPNSMMLRRTLFLLTVCGILAFARVGLRLVKLQIVDHEMYEKMAIEQQVRDVNVEASRGTIYDRNMKILAMSASVNDIFISPAEINMYDEDPELIAKGLSEILEIDYDSIIEKTKNKESWYQTIAKKVEPEISDKVRKFKDEHELKGIKLEESNKRYYPYSNSAAHIIGFVGQENQGFAGIEAEYNNALTGIDGRVVRVKNAVGTDMLFTSYEDYYDAVNGNDVVSTIDQNIQHYIEKHLNKAVEDFKCKNGAAAIAMEVDTGAILGWASIGDFDPNNYQIVNEDAQKIIDAEPNEEKKQELLNNAQFLQWRNKGLSDTYEPGSTFKIITMAMALNEGVVHQDDSFYCDGTVDVLGRTKPVNCWKHGGHGSQNLVQALQHSCNVAFVNIGQRVGAEKFYDYCEAFGFFDASSDPDASLTGKTGIDLGGESGSIWWSKNVFCDPNNKSQLAAASFGQTFNITPIQLITAVSACCNGGYLMKPHVVKEIIDSQTGNVEKIEPERVRQVISEDTSKTLCSMLEQVVGDKVEGTGKNAYVAGYRIGGKTGTSTNTNVEAATGAKQYIVSFIGVAPINDPKIALLVLLDSPSNNTGVYVSGGQMAAPVVGKMMSDILPYMGVEPDYSADEKKVMDKQVPKLKGLTKDEAISKLVNEGFLYRIVGDGANITDQLPKPGSVIAAESQVILYCDETPAEGQEIMPDLTGLTYSVARQKLGSMSLFVRASGGVSDPATVVVSGQSIAPGTVVEHGKIIEVSVSDKSNLGRY